MTKKDLTAKCGERYLPKAENAEMPESAYTWNNATVDAKIKRRQSRLFLLKSAVPLMLTSPSIPGR